MKLRQGVQRSDFQQPLGRLCVTSGLLYQTPGKISSGVLRKTKDVASFIYSFVVANSGAGSCIFGTLVEVILVTPEIVLCGYL
jgi:hypothetical protein